jgi:hypothetical protein
MSYHLITPGDLVRLKAIKNEVETSECGLLTGLLRAYHLGNKFSNDVRRQRYAPAQNNPDILTTGYEVKS